MVVACGPVKAACGKAVGVLGGLTVVAFLLALGRFDAYVAVLAQILLLATIVTGVLRPDRGISESAAPALATACNVPILLLRG